MAANSRTPDARGQRLGASPTAEGSRTFSPLTRVSGDGTLRRMEASPIADLRGVSVLVVDDRADHRELLALHFEIEGARTREAADAGEAMEIVATDAPALVVTDIHMPDRDGIWLLKRVRELRPNTAVIAVSGVSDIDEAAKAGFDAALQKPFDFSALSAAAANALAARAARSAADPTG